jgi:hypothetical protein
MIGTISRAYVAGRQDRLDGRPAASARARGETAKTHTFYLMGWQEFRFRPGQGFPQLELTPPASQAVPGTRLDTARD